MKPAAAEGLENRISSDKTKSFPIIAAFNCLDLMTESRHDFDNIGAIQLLENTKPPPKNTLTFRFNFTRDKI